MVSSENLLSYIDWKITFTVHTDASDKQLCAVIIQNNEPIKLLSKILSNPQRDYTTTKKGTSCNSRMPSSITRNYIWLRNKCILR